MGISSNTSPASMDIREKMTRMLMNYDANRSSKSAKVNVTEEIMNATEHAKKALSYALLHALPMSKLVWMRDILKLICALIVSMKLQLATPLTATMCLTGKNMVVIKGMTIMTLVII